MGPLGGADFRRADVSVVWMAFCRFWAKMGRNHCPEGVDVGLLGNAEQVPGAMFLSSARRFWPEI